MNLASRCHVTMMIAAASLVVALWPDASPLLEFDRVAVGAGDWWRVLTGHLTHFGLEHLVWDAGVFAVLGVLCERRHRRATLACLGAAAVLIPAATWLLVPEIRTYRGLSGLDTALFALLGVMMVMGIKIPMGPVWRTQTRSAAAYLPIPRTSGADCRCSSAGGSRNRPGSICGRSRRGTCRPTAAR